MSVETFHFVLSSVIAEFENFRKSLSHAEKLVVSIKWDSEEIFSSLKHPDRLPNPPGLLLNEWWRFFYSVDEFFLCKDDS